MKMAFKIISYLILGVCWLFMSCFIALADDESQGTVPFVPGNPPILEMLMNQAQEEPGQETYFIEFYDEPAARHLGPYPHTQADYQTAQDYAIWLLAKQQNGYLPQIEEVIPGFSQRNLQQEVLGVNGIFFEGTLDEKEAIASLSSIVKQVHKNNFMEHLVRQSVPHIGANLVWELQPQGYTGEGVSIAIMDTGIDYTHSDFGGCTTEQFLSGNCAKVAGGYDFADGDSDPFDDWGYGSYIAGISAANSIAADGQPFKGVAPDATLYAYRVISPGTIFIGLPTSVFVSAVTTVMDPNGDLNFEDHLDVLSISFGDNSRDVNNPNAVESQQVNSAVDVGVVVVIGAGNRGRYMGITMPGTAEKAITVGASNDINDNLADFTSKGPLNDGVIKPDVVAPGTAICSSRSSDFHTLGSACDPVVDDAHVQGLTGTSAATPHVAGVAALLLQQHPDWNPEEIRQAIRNSAINLEGVDPNYNVFAQGYGRVSAIDAVEEPRPVVTELGKVSDDFDEVQFAGNFKVYGQENEGTYSYVYNVGYMGPDPATQPENLHNPEWWLGYLHQNGTINLQSGTPVATVFNSIDKNLLTQDGVYLVKLEVFGNARHSTAYHSFRVDLVKITAPYNADVYSAEPFDISGSILLAAGRSYTIEYTASNNENWVDNGIVLANNGTEPIVEGSLATFDIPTNLETGFYRFRINIYEEQIIVHSEDFGFIRIDKELRAETPFRIPIGPIYYGGATGTYPDFNFLVPTIKDFDADGEKEFSFFSHSPDGSNSAVYVIETDGTFGENGVVLTPPGWMYQQNLLNRLSLHIDDIDNDGLLDFSYNKIGKFFTRIYSQRFFSQSRDGTLLFSWNMHLIGGYPFLPRRPLISFVTSADLDHDTEKELIFLSIGRPDSGWQGWGLRKFIRVTNLRGEPRVGWYAPDFEVPNCRSGFVEPHLSIGELDGDDELEIVYYGPSEAACDGDPNTPKGKVYILNLDATGVSWYIQGFGRSAPTLADFNNDGIDEIVLVSFRLDLVPGEEIGEVGIYTAGGEPLAGWPRQLELSTGSSVGPQIADIDGDGYLDIVVANYHPYYDFGQKIYVFRANGELLNENWPITNHYNDILGQVLADVDGDGYLDIIYNDIEAENGYYFTTIHAKNRFGQELVNAHFPKYVELGLSANSVIDIDADGMLELVATSDGTHRLYENGDDAQRINYYPRQSIYVWDLDVVDSSLAHIWSVAGGKDYDRHGRYEGLSAPINFSAQRQGWDIALSWQNAPLSEYLLGYVVQISQHPDFSDASSIDLSLEENSYIFHQSFRPGSYYLRIGSFDTDNPRHTMWSAVKRVCIGCIDDEDTIPISAIETTNIAISPNEIYSITPYNPAGNRDVFIEE